MAINKNDYLDGDGNYDLKKALVDELIDGVNTLINPTTTTINTFENGWEGFLTLSRYGALVSIKGTLNKTGTVDFNTQLTTIPTGFRPSHLVSVAVAKGNIHPYNSTFLFQIQSNGSLVVRTSDTIPTNQSDATLVINQIYQV